MFFTHAIATHSPRDVTASAFTCAPHIHTHHHTHTPSHTHTRTRFAAPHTSLHTTHAHTHTPTCPHTYRACCVAPFPHAHLPLHFHVHVLTWFGLALPICYHHFLFEHTVTPAHTPALSLPLQPRPCTYTPPPPTTHTTFFFAHTPSSHTTCSSTAPHTHLCPRRRVPVSDSHTYSISDGGQL